MTKDSNIRTICALITTTAFKYPNDLRPYYNDGIWYSADYKYYDPWAYIVNPRFALTLKEFRYSAVDIQNPPCIISYLRTYIKYPQAEYLVKAGLGKYVGSTMILKKIGDDKGFCKWLMANRDELKSRHYYVDVVLRGYKTRKPLKALQAYREAKINLRSNDSLKLIRDLFTGSQRERFFDYISSQNTNVNTYNDYLKACIYLGLDMSLPKNRFKKSAFICVIARSPADLINEGEVLHHCVGRMNYDQRFVREESLIFFVRAKESPDIPLVTLEYSPRSHKVLQCYGEHDHKPSEDILHYVNKIWLPYANRTIKKLAA